MVDKVFVICQDGSEKKRKMNLNEGHIQRNWFIIGKNNKYFGSFRPYFHMGKSSLTQSRISPKFAMY